MRKVRSVLKVRKVRTNQLCSEVCIVLMFKFSEKETSLTDEVVCRLDESLVWTQVLQFSDFGNPEVKAIKRKVCLLLEP